MFTNMFHESKRCLGINFVGGEVVFGFQHRPSTSLLSAYFFEEAGRGKKLYLMKPAAANNVKEEIGIRMSHSS